MPHFGNGPHAPAILPARSRGALPSGIGVFTFILLIARMLKLVELVVNRSVPILEIAKLFAYILPTFLEVTVPMALLLAVLAVFRTFVRRQRNRRAQDLRHQPLSNGRPRRRVSRCSVTLLALLLAIYARPWGNSNSKASLYEIAKTRASAGSTRARLQRRLRQASSSTSSTSSRPAIGSKAF